MSTLFRLIPSRRSPAVEEMRAKNAAFRTQSIELRRFSPAKSQLICVASGKGGVGKTLVSTNIAVSLARRGLRVTLLDADFGLANAHLLLGMTPKYDISHVVRGERTLNDVIETGPAGVRLIPGGAGRAELAMMPDANLFDLSRELFRLEGDQDLVVADLGAGIGGHVLRFLSAAHDIILVSDHEATAQSDAMATIGMLAETLGSATIHIVINRARDRDHSVVAFQRMWTKVNRAWRGRIKLYFSGWIPNNWYVRSSVMLGKPLVTRHPHSLAARCIQTMGDKLHRHHLVWRSRQVSRFGVQSAFEKLAILTNDGY